MSYILHRQASALIMVILLIVLMVSMAVGFMSMVGRQRGSAIITAAQTKADIAAQHAQMHAIKTFVEDAADTTLKYATMHNPRWRTEFSAVTDPDGDPYTNDGVAKPAGTRHSLTPHADRVSMDPLVNSKDNLFDMTGYPVSREYPGIFGFGSDYDRYSSSSYTHISKWHNVEFLDAHFQHIGIDDSLTEAQKADLRRQARYVVRYIVQVFDLNGTLCINNNYPDGPIAPGTNAISDPEYVRYQNYLRCYGRSIKSMFSCYWNQKAYGAQMRSNDPGFISVDPLDDECLNVDAIGEALPRDHYNMTGNTKYFSLENDGRLRVERAFRGDLQWAGRTSGLSGNYPFYIQDTMGALHKSKAYSWGHINQIFIGESVRHSHDSHSDVVSLAPFGEGFHKQDSEYMAPTPWHVNVLTAPNVTLARMVMGLSSELHYSRTRREFTTGDWGSQADLFGVAYPEAFPIGLDEGRDVPLVGDGTIAGNGDRVMQDDGTTFDGFPSFYKSGWTVFTRAIAGQSGISASPGYENSYLMDIAMAINMSLRNVRQVWVKERDLDTGAEQASPAVNPRVFQYRNGVNNSYINKTVTDPVEMKKLLIREICRIVGEGHIDTSASPAVSKDFYDHTKESVLSGGVSSVGPGSMGFRERLTQLPAHANTRAMEYALNDFLISLFGKANPDFNEYDPRRPSASFAAISDDIAVDFNGDGVPESSVTGWHDAETDERVWSFWWDGVGPYTNIDYDYMKRGAWYRLFNDGSIRRKSGSEWLDLSNAEVSLFNLYNEMWLTGNNSYPIKPIAKTGRFFIGKSKILQGFIRGEVYNILNGSQMAMTNRTFVYHVDPNNDGNYGDSHVLNQADSSMVVPGQ